MSHCASTNSLTEALHHPSPDHISLCDLRGPCPPPPPKKQHVYMIELYFTLQSCTKVQEQFQRRYADVYISKMAIQQLLPIFMRQELYRTSRNWATVCVVCRKPWRYVGVPATLSKKKSQKLASWVQMPYSITQKAVRKLDVHAYCVRAVQELKVWIQ